MFQFAVACLVITVGLAYVNHRFLRLPATIGVMALALGFTLVVAVLDHSGLVPGLQEQQKDLVLSLNFSEVVIQGMLSALLFAGALDVNLREMRPVRWPVIGLALVGTLASALLIGYALHWTLAALGLALPLLYCLMFGALISPTDPVAVLGILDSAGAPRRLELVITGESLFNDGVGIVAFVVVLGMLHGSGPPTVGQVALLLLRQAGGGIAFGVALGWLVYWLLKPVDDYKVEVMLTLAAVMGGYAAAGWLGVSGPLTAVAMGLVIGNHARRLAISSAGRRYLDMFWEMIDEILNALLFVLLAMQVLLIRFSWPLLLAGAVAIIVALGARALAVGLPVALMGERFGLVPGAWRVLTWGGLRGGISVALALALPGGPERNAVLAITYCVVVFSILVQGLSMGRVVQASLGPRREDAAADGKQT